MKVFSLRQPRSAKSNWALLFAGVLGSLVGNTLVQEFVLGALAKNFTLGPQTLNLGLFGVTLWIHANLGGLLGFVLGLVVYRRFF